MKKILCMLLAVLLLASLSTSAFADGRQKVYEDIGITLTYTDEFYEENLKGVFDDRPSGKIDDGLYYATFIYYAMSEEELNIIVEKEEDVYPPLWLNRVRLCDSVDCSPPGSSVHGSFQATELK